MPHDHGKIVRDRIPEIIAASGKRAVYDTMSDEEMLRGLSAKLVEEAREFEESGASEELADVMEVIYALLARRGERMETIEELRLKKRAARGGFENNLRLIAVEEDK